MHCLELLGKTKPYQGIRLDSNNNLFSDVNGNFGIYSLQILLERALIEKAEMDGVPYSEFVLHIHNWTKRGTCNQGRSGGNQLHRGQPMGLTQHQQIGQRSQQNYQVDQDSVFDSQQLSLHSRQQKQHLRVRYEQLNRDYEQVDREQHRSDHMVQSIQPRREQLLPVPMNRCVYTPLRNEHRRMNQYKVSRHEDRLSRGPLHHTDIDTSTDKFNDGAANWEEEEGLENSQGSDETRSNDDGEDLY